jgi:hypothetical protein
MCQRLRPGQIITQGRPTVGQQLAPHARTRTASPQTKEKNTAEIVKDVAAAVIQDRIQTLNGIIAIIQEELKQHKGFSNGLDESEQINKLYIIIQEWTKLESDINDEISNSKTYNEMIDSIEKGINKQIANEDMYCKSPNFLALLSSLNSLNQPCSVSADESYQEADPAPLCHNRYGSSAAVSVRLDHINQAVSLPLPYTDANEGLGVRSLSERTSANLAK